MTPEESAKWTAERRAALRKTIEVARAFVRCADEFVPREGEHFYPDALQERAEALAAAFIEELDLWDGVPDAPVQLPEFDRGPLATLPPCDAFVAPAGNPGARVVRFG